jgi:hypothetical protein
MSLVGRLEDISLPEILQVVSLTGKTGKLTLSTGVDEGLIVIRNGRIIYAASNSTREALGHLLLQAHLVDEEALREALDRQFRSREENRLGRILVDMGAIRQENLDGVLQRQVWRVLSELFEWRHGFFKFRSFEIEDHGEVEVDARDLLIEKGLDSEGMALELARRWDELQRASGDFSRTASPAEGQPGSSTEEAEGVVRTSLSSLIADLAPPTLTGEGVAQVIRVAERAAGRGVLFARRGEGLACVAYFGLGDTTASRLDWLNTEQWPLHEEAVVAPVIRTRRRYLGKLPETPWNRALITALGSKWPRQAAVVPGLRQGKVALVLYLDDAVRGRPIGPLESVEAALTALAGTLGARQRPTPTPR